MCPRDGRRRQEQKQYRRSHERINGYVKGRPLEACLADTIIEHAVAEAQAS